MADSQLKGYGADLARFIKQIGKNIFALPEILGSADELEALSEAKAFMESRLGGVQVEISPESASTHQKAKNAMPGKPAIVLE